MVIRIKKKAAKTSLKSKLKKASSSAKKIDWDKYVGKIQIPVDAISYQKKIRNEWPK
jgi:hypothetical protein